MIAMFFIAFGFFTLIPMSNEYPAVMPEGLCPHTPYPIPHTHNTLSVCRWLCSTGIDDHEPIGTNISFVNIYNNTVDLRGCRYPAQHWCITVNKIYLFQYAIALVLIAIGYPTSSVMAYSIYSKILGSGKQVFIMFM